MKKAIALAGGLACALPQLCVAQDMAVAEKWSKAKVIKYTIEGVHKARVPVVFGDYEGKGDVFDRITVEYTWDVGKRAIVGPVKVTDGATEVTNLKSDKTNCGPPQLKGPYEHFQSTSSAKVADLYEIKGTRTYPPASVSNYPASCSMRSVPGSKQNVVVHIGLSMEPTVLAMPNMAGSPITISADRKSFTMKGAEGWAWTYTPTIVQ